MKRFLLGLVVAISLPVLAASLWPSGPWLETFQNGFLFGNGKILSVLNGVITFDDKRLDDRSKNIYFQEDFEGESVSFTCDANLTASDETGSPISGLTSKLITQSAGALGQKCSSGNIDLDEKQKGTLLSLCMTGVGENFDLVGYDVTNSKELVRVAFTDKSQEYCAYFNTLSSTNQIRYDLEARLEVVSSTLKFDDAQGLVNPLTPTEAVSYQSISNIQNGGTSSPITQSGTFSGNNLFTFNDSLYVEGDNILAIGNFSGSDGLTLTATRKARVNGSLTLYNNGGTAILVDVFKMDKDGSTIKHISRATEAEAQTSAIQSSFSYDLEAGEFLLFSGALGYQNSATLTVNAQAEGKGVVVKNRTDSASVENVFSARVANPAGTSTVTSENVDWIASNSDNGSGNVILTLASGLFGTTPSCSVAVEADVNTKIAKIKNVSTSSIEVNVEDSATGTDNNYDFAIICQRQGTDYIKETDKVYTVPVDSLTGNSVRAESWAAGGTVGAGNTFSFDEVSDNGSAWDGSTYTVQKNNSKVEIKTSIFYNSGVIERINLYKNGTFYRNIGITANTNSHGGSFVSSQGEFVEGDALTIRPATGGTVPASPSSALHYLNINESYGDRGTFLGTFGQPTCYVKDVKPSNTDGGTSVATTWTKRTLNNTSGSCGFLSLSSDTVTLESGSYNVECSSPYLRVDSAHTRFRNATDGTTALSGSMGYSSPADTVHTISNIMGSITIGASKSFELQYYTTTSTTTNDLGARMASGESNVYSQCKITKVR